MRKAGKWTKADERSTMRPSRMERKEGRRGEKRKQNEIRGSAKKWKIFERERERERPQKGKEICAPGEKRWAELSH